MIYLALPIGSSWGWGVAGLEIAKAMKTLGVECEVVLPDAELRTDKPVLHALLGATFEPYCGKVLSSTRNVGYMFAEWTDQIKPHLRKALEYDVICVGSQWAKEQLLSLNPVTPVQVVWQGVDHDVFHPDPTPKSTKEFRVFSGGKFEYRKGQDVVIAAMRDFLRLHGDVKLVAAWANQWPPTMGGMAGSKYIKYVDGPCWESAVVATLLANDICIERVEIVPIINDRKQMADVYRSCHVAAFPSRCEAGTNLPLMECIACGVPIIAVNATGQRDVLTPLNSAWIGYKQLDNGWVEPDPVALFDMLEFSYSVWKDWESNLRLPVGIGPFTWENTAKAFLEVLQ